MVALASRKNKKSKKKILTLLAIVGAMILAYLVTAWFMKYPPFLASKGYEPGEDVVNLERSQTEKEASRIIEANPESKLENSQTDTPPAPATNEQTGMREVNVLLTSAGVFNNRVSVAGMVTDVAESGGKCSFIFTNGADKLVKVTDTLANPSSTSCRTASFSADELGKLGAWRVHIEYRSDTSTGVSNTKEFNKG